MTLTNKGKYRVLVVPDLQCPFDHRDAPAFLSWAKKKYSPDIVVNIGDEMDFNAISDWDHDPDGMSAGQELKKGIEHLQEYYDLFPNSKVCISNHTARPFRRAFKYGIPSAFIRDYREFLKAPKGWEWRDHWEVDGIRYEHGEGQSGSLGALRAALKNGQSTVIGHLHCIPQSYQVLTARGEWRAITEVSHKDTVLGYENGRVVFANVLSTTSGLHSGAMVKFNSRACSQLVTDNHGMYLRDGKYILAKDLKGSGRTLKDFVYKSEPLAQHAPNEFSNDFLRLLVAFCADGSFNSYEGPIPQASFHFRKPRKIERLTQLIKNLGYEIAWTQTKEGTYKSHTISRDLRILLKEFAPEKKLPLWLLSLSPAQRQVVIEELPLWDGTTAVGDSFNSYQFGSVKTEEIDLVQALLLFNGYRSTRRASGWGVQYNDRVEFKDSHNLASIMETSKVKDYPVACLTTSTRNFFIRTDKGSVELTGNSDAGILYNANEKSLFYGFNVGCLIDRHAYAFRYAKFAPKKQILGVGLVTKGVPQFIPMLINSKHRWVKS